MSDIPRRTIRTVRQQRMLRNNRRPDSDANADHDQVPGPGIRSEMILRPCRSRPGGRQKAVDAELLLQTVAEFQIRPPFQSEISRGNQHTPFRVDVPRYADPDPSQL